MGLCLGLFFVLNTQLSRLFTSLPPPPPPFFSVFNSTFSVDSDLIFALVSAKSITTSFSFSQIHLLKDGFCLKIWREGG